MIASLYQEENEHLTGIIANEVGSGIEEILWALSKEINEKPLNNEQLQKCECFGILLWNDDSIGYFFMIGGNLVINLKEEWDNSDFRIKVYNMLIINIKLYYPQLIENLQIKQNSKVKRVPA